jgi:hypothetical protein
LKKAYLNGWWLSTNELAALLKLTTATVRGYGEQRIFKIFFLLSFALIANFGKNFGSSHCCAAAGDRTL